MEMVLTTYSNTEKKALDWTEELIVLRRTVENLSELNFNSCLLNLYHDGGRNVLA